MYTGYRGVANTTVAKFSPSGYYIACGSTGGWLNIVASKRNDEGDFIEKAKYEVLSGPVKDIAWSMDNQRCLVVGSCCHPGGSTDSAGRHKAAQSAVGAGCGVPESFARDAAQAQLEQEGVAAVLQLNEDRLCDARERADSPVARAPIRNSNV